MFKVPATIACLLLILVAYRRDRRITRDLSFGVWIPVLWLTIISSKAVSQWLMVGGSDSADAVESGSPVDRLFFSLMIGVAIFWMAKKRADWGRISSSNPWLVMLVVFAATSVLWSDYPLVAFKRIVRAAGTAIVVLTVLTETDPSWAVQTVIRRVSLLLVPLSALLIKYYDIGVGWDEYGGVAFVGVTNNKNTLGRVGLISTLYFLSLILNRKQDKDDGKALGFILSAIYLAASFWVLTKANSATSLGCTYIGIVLLLLHRFVGISRTTARGLVYLGIPLLVTFVLSFGSLGSLTASVGRDATLTGRTELWAELLEMSGNPLVGTGYGSFWIGERLRTLWERHWWSPNMAHNGYLEIYLELGLIGLAILVALLVSCFGKVQQKLEAKSPHAGLYLAVFFIFLFYNMTESATSMTAMMWFIFLLFGVGLTPRYDPKARTASAFNGARLVPAARSRPSL